MNSMRDDNGLYRKVGRTPTHLGDRKVPTNGVIYTVDEAGFREWNESKILARSTGPARKNEYLQMSVGKDTHYFGKGFGNAYDSAVNGRMRVRNRDVGKYISGAYNTREKFKRLRDNRLHDPLTAAISQYMSEVRKDSKSWDLKGYQRGTGRESAIAGVNPRPEGKYLATGDNYVKQVAAEAAVHEADLRPTLDYIILHENVHLDHEDGGTLSHERRVEGRIYAAIEKAMNQIKNAAGHSEAYKTRLMGYLRHMQKVAKNRFNSAHFNYDSQGAIQHYKAALKEAVAKGYRSVEAIKSYAANKMRQAKKSYQARQTRRNNKKQMAKKTARNKKTRAAKRSRSRRK